MFRRLGVFAATFDLEAAESVCAADGIESWQVLDLLSLLVDKNLVSVDDSDDTARYRLLETMRLYAQDRLAAAGDEHETRGRHRDYYLSVAERAAPQLEGPDAPSWAVSLTVDWPNFEAALVCSRDRNETAELCRLVTALAVLWTPGGTNWQIPAAVGSSWVDTALAAIGTARTAQRASLLWASCALAYNVYDLATMSLCGEEGLQIARELGDDRLTGRCLTALAWARAHSQQAGQIWDEAAGASRRAGDTYMLLTQLSAGVGTFHIHRNPAKGRDALSEANALLASGRWPANFDANVSVIDGWLALLEGRLGDATVRFDHARQIESASTTALVAAEGFCALVMALRAAHDDSLAAADRHSELANRVGTQRYVLEFQARALVASARGDHAGAADHAAGALAAATIAPFRASALGTAARVQLAADQNQAALRHVNELSELARTEGFVFSAAGAQVLDSHISRRQGNLGAAELAAMTALTHAVDTPAWTTVVDALEALAGLATEAGSHDEAARLFGAASTVRDSIGYRLSLTERDADLTRVRAAVRERFDSLYAIGGALTIPEAVAYVKRGRGERKRPVTGWASLTPMENQIVELIGEGQTNGQIGDRLFVSSRTVQTHLTRIYAKVNVSSLGRNSQLKR